MGELLHPAADGLELVLHHRRVVEVQLHQLAVALPALVPEAVVPVGVAVKVDVEPVLIGAVPLLLLHVPEGPETPAHVVEHPVQHDPQPRVVESPAHLGQVLVGAQPGVQPVVVPGVIAVLVAVKDRIQEDGVRPKLPDMLRPGQQAADAGHGDSVVVLGRAAQAQGINLVQDRFVKPHGKKTPFAPPVSPGKSLLSYRIFAGFTSPKGTFPPLSTGPRAPPLPSGLGAESYGRQTVRPSR